MPIIGGPTGGRPSVGQRLSAGVGRALEMGQQMAQEQSQNEALKKAGFEDLIGVNPDLQKAVITERLKGQEKENLFKKKANLLGFGENLGQTSHGDNLRGDQGQAASQDHLDAANISDDYIAKVSLIDPNVARSLQHAKDIALREQREQKHFAFEKEKFGEKQKAEERAYQTNYSKKAEDEADVLRQSLPKKEMALDFARNSVETGDLSYFSPDKLAEATGIDLFRTAKGAQLITAGKENLLSNLSRVSSKGQNLWFEQRLNSMFPKIGQSKEANLTVQEMLEGENLLDKAYLNEFDRLATEDQDKYGFVRKDIKKRALDALKPIEKDIMKRTTYRMKEIEEQENGLQKLKPQIGKNVPKGTPLTLAMAKLYKEKFGDNALNVAEKNGYYIPTVEDYQMIRASAPEYREQLST